MNIDPKRLRILAGKAAFDRGRAYFLDGRVTELRKADKHVTAIVLGNKGYSINLKITSRGIEGYCNCPASDGIDFCKHCVAAALQLAEQEERSTALAEGGPEERLEAFLLQLNEESLRALILKLARKDDVLQQRLVQRADLAMKAPSLAALKKMITAASPMRSIWRGDSVAAYYDQFAMALDEVLDLADRIPGDMLLKLVDHGQKRVDKSFEHIDTSNGEYDVVHFSLGAMHAEGMARVDWPIARQSQHVLDRLINDEYGMYYQIKDAYLGTLSKLDLATFYETARIRLDALPPLAFGADYKLAREHDTLLGVLRPRLEELGDTRTLIELLKKCCHNANDRLQIAELLLQHKEFAECEDWLNRYDRDSKPNPRSLDLRISLYVSQERWAEAVDLQKARLFNALELPHLHKLYKLAEHSNQLNIVRKEVPEFLQTQLTRHHWISQRAAKLLAALAMEREDLDAYYSLHMQYVTDSGTLLSASKELAPQPHRACALIDRVVESSVEKKTNSSYQYAVATLVESKPLFDALGPDAFARKIELMKERHKPKRNLIALLQAID